MIDIHTHILPNVDDGSKSIDLSLEMLKEEVRQGVDTVFLTPHFRGAYANSPERLKQGFDNFSALVKEEGIPVTLLLGEEVYVKKDIKRLILDREVIGLADKNLVLLEFDYFERCEIANVAHEMKCIGYKPIIAHVERYEYLSLADIYDVKKVGGLIQVNADSLTGVNKHLFKSKIKAMFKQGLVDFVASDVHSNRQNCMQSAYNYVCSKFGVEAAEVTFNLNAKRILKG